MLAAAEVISLLDLAAHPEGGWFRETWRHDPGPGAADSRGAGTAIYYLLAAGERSHWHRVDATEVWHFYDGDPLELSMPDGTVTLSRERPQVVVPAGVWQSARSLGAWTLVGCTVSPPFEFSRFELAPPGWEPGEGDAAVLSD